MSGTVAGNIRVLLPQELQQQRQRVSTAAASGIAAATTEVATRQYDKGNSTAEGIVPRRKQHDSANDITDNDSMA